MNIGKRVDYALRALSYLAAQTPDCPVSRREIQTKQDIPAHFLSKIMKRLESGGFVQSYSFSLIFKGLSKICGISWNS